MNLPFYKYQGTGNDFVMIDNRELLFPKQDSSLIAQLCDRRFGIGADGLILLENDDATDFKMVYFNADGNEGSMCGNGGRSIVAFANFLNIIEDSTVFNAVDGIHEAILNDTVVSLKMQDVSDITIRNNTVFMDTGSPHHVQMVSDLENFEVYREGAKLRYGLYGKPGSNINFVEQESNDSFAIRTYERGVEDETLSCGTGVTAAALAMHKTAKTQNNKVIVNARGGQLEVSFNVAKDGYNNIFLTGAAKQVFKGEITI
ncbi:diaminopimelate epimerase [Maribacter sp. CXY002]|uniref:diaminopimelate epimerase n=1 Tax=Maribacter luteocoastalis TaxID=3407671 RepID=UPI003B685DA4